MSEGYQRIYHGILKTCGPVFIGAGNKIIKKEYLFFDRRSSIGVIDTPAFYGFLQNRGKADKYEEFLLHERRKDLYSWIKENGIRLEEVEPYLKYRIPVGSFQIDGAGGNLDVLEGIKDPYGLPYVPGSSVKGMIRTLLLSSYILQGRLIEQSRYSIMQAAMSGSGNNRNSFLARENSHIETELLHTLDRKKERIEDAVNDMLSGLIISDSKPLSTDDMVLCQRIEVHPDGEEKKLNILRECIRPGATISFDITIDSKLCDVTGVEIMEAVKLFDEMYRECFLNAFKCGLSIPEDSVFLGGGSGFVSKTVAYSIFEKEEGIDFVQNVFNKTKVPREHRHDLDKKYGVSPHILKCSRINGKLFQMGLCQLRIE